MSSVRGATYSDDDAPLIDNKASTTGQNDSDDEPLFANAAKPTKAPAKGKVAKGDLKTGFSRIEQMIQQQLQESKEDPICNYGPGAQLHSDDDDEILAPPAPKVEKEPVKPKTAPKKKWFGNRKSAALTQKFRTMKDDETDDDEEEVLNVLGNIDDMVLGAERALEKYGGDAVDDSFQKQTADRLAQAMTDYADEKFTAEELVPKVKRVAGPRVPREPKEPRLKKRTSTSEGGAAVRGPTKKRVKTDDDGAGTGAGLWKRQDKKATTTTRSDTQDSWASRADANKKAMWGEDSDKDEEMPLATKKSDGWGDDNNNWSGGWNNWKNEPKEEVVSEQPKVTTIKLSLSALKARRAQKQAGNIEPPQSVAPVRSATTPVGAGLGLDDDDEDIFNEKPKISLQAPPGMPAIKPPVDFRKTTFFSDAGLIARRNSRPQFQKKQSKTFQKLLASVRSF